MPAIRQAADFHLTSLKFSFADDASAFVIERLPGSKSISCAQYGEPVIESEMSDHMQKAVCSSHRRAQSGRWMIVWSGKILEATS